MKGKRIYKLSKSEKNFENIKFTINKIIQICTDNNYKKIAVTTSSSKERGVGCFVAIFNRIIEEKKKELICEEIKPINMYADEFEKIKKFEVVILIERYGDSYYTDVLEIKNMLNEIRVPYVGVITCK